MSPLKVGSVLDDEPLRLACKTAISVFRLAISENLVINYIVR